MPIQYRYWDTYSSSITGMFIQMQEADLLISYGITLIRKLLVLARSICHVALSQELARVYYSLLSPDQLAHWYRSNMAVVGRVVIVYPSCSYLLIVIELKATWLLCAIITRNTGGQARLEKSRSGAVLNHTPGIWFYGNTHAHSAITWCTTHSVWMNALSKTSKNLLKAIGIILWHKHAR